jgi:hypothetical protein
MRTAPVLHSTTQSARSAQSTASTSVGDDLLDQIEEYVGRDDDGYRAFTLGRLVERLRPIASTISGSEGQALADVANAAIERHWMDPNDFGRVVSMIEGSAYSLPTSYRDSAARGQGRAAVLSRALEAEYERLRHTTRTLGDDVFANRIERQLEGLEEGLMRNLDLARSNPTTARTRLNYALSTSDVDETIRRLFD